MGGRLIVEAAQTFPYNERIVAVPERPRGAILLARRFLYEGIRKEAALQDAQVDKLCNE